jgi:hypothetical protein
METGIMETVAKVAGIGGIAFGVVLILFRDIVRKSIFPKLSPKDAYRLLTTITVAVFAIAIAGVGAWVWVGTHPAPRAAIEAGRDIGAGGDINLEGGAAGGGIKAGQDVNAGGDINVGK